MGVLREFNAAALGGGNRDVLCGRCHPTMASVNVFLNGRRWGEGYGCERQELCCSLS